MYTERSLPSSGDCWDRVKYRFDFMLVFVLANGCVRERRDSVLRDGDDKVVQSVRDGKVVKK